MRPERSVAKMCKYIEGVMDMAADLEEYYETAGFADSHIIDSKLLKYNLR